MVIAWWRLIVAILVFTLFHTTASAQVSSADLVGRVTDTTGAVLPGATVTIRHVSTGTVRSTPSNSSGDYVFTLLPIGEYEVTIELAGFSQQKSKVTLSTGDRFRVDGRLALGGITEQVTVTAEVPLLQTDSSTVGTLINLREVQDLPSSGRNFVRLVQSLPGANEGLPNSLASGTRPDDRRQTSAISINGALDNQNNQLIDGVDNNERAIGTIGIKPSIDAIAEIKVQTSNYTAEVGRTAGGVVNVITKSGTNQFSGSAFVFARDDRFDEKDYFSPTKPQLSQKQFGGSFGGPLRTNRTFFFADYEGFRHTSGVTNVTTVPTARMRTGDFSELSGIIYDPLTRQPFQGNQIPSSRFDPIGLRYMNLFPLPTTGGLASNYASVTERTQESLTSDVRIDHAFTPNALMFFRYSYNDVDTFTPSGCPPNSDGINPNCSTGGANRFPGPNVTKAHSTQANFVRTWSPSLLSEIRGGYLKMDIQSLPVNYGRNVSDEFGIPGANFDEFTSGLLPLTISGYSSLGEANFVPLIQLDDTWQINAAVTKITGSHSIKLGASYLSRKFTVWQSAQPLGQLTFDSRVTNNGAGVGGDAIASLLLGYPSQVLRSHSLFKPTYHTAEPGAFVQDDWRVRDWLTLNLGVRYDVFTPLTEEGNHLSNFDIPTASIIVAGQSGTSQTAGVSTDYGNIAPRLGFAATLPANMVLRGGYGLAYFPGNMLSGAWMKNQPYESSFGPLLSTAATTAGAPSLFTSQGVPSPQLSNAVNPVGSIRAVGRDFRSTRAQQYNVILEKELYGSVVSVGYVGSRADFVAGGKNINQAPVGPGNVQARRPYNGLLPGISNITIFDSQFEASYDGLQLVFQRRYRGGLSFNSNYTWSHTTNTAAVPWDQSQIEEFDAPNDLRHRVVFTVNYELPFGRSASGVAAALIRDWQINMVAGWQTGLPFDITNSTARANTGAGDRPNLVGDPHLDNQTVERWFDTSAFVAQPANTIGSDVVKRNLLHGPSRRSVDLSVMRSVPFNGTMRLQFRVEAFNVFNTVNFGNPSGALGASDFGRITGTAGPPRQIQFAAKLLF